VRLTKSVLPLKMNRQLGDIRPLVENSDELAKVAKGLLDTVIGRLDDEGQRNLLSKVCETFKSTFVLGEYFGSHSVSILVMAARWRA
jgi:hypothetical protein